MYMELPNIVMPLSLNRMETCIPVGPNYILNLAQEKRVKCNGPRLDTRIFELGPYYYYKGEGNVVKT